MISWGRMRRISRVTRLRRGRVERKKAILDAHEEHVVNATEIGCVALLNFAHGDELIARNFRIVVALIAIRQNHVGDFDALARHLDHSAGTDKVRVVRMGHNDEHALYLAPIRLLAGFLVAHGIPFY